jgi:DNA repair protein RecO (recombination protein O)
MATYIKTNALVLGAIRWRESSKIVHLFSEDYGYLSVVAKGALRPKSPFRGALETLNLVEIIATTKAGRDLHTLTAATLLNGYQHIRDDLAKTAAAFAAAELVQQLLKSHEPIPSFFNYMTEWLEILNNSDFRETRPYLWLLMFEISRVLGFGWELENCPEQQRPPETFPVYLDFVAGSIVCQQRKISRSDRLALQQSDWQRLVQLNRLPISAFREWLQSYPAANFPDITSALLAHLAYHTETRLTLKSLNWYV